VPLADFDPPIAEAVVTVLRRAGLPAAVGEATDEEATVVVPADRREEAFAVLGRSMDAVHSELAEARAVAVRRAPQPPELDEYGEEYGRPLVFERLRQFGFLAVLLVPLLVVTLAQVRLPAVYMAVAVIAGVVALTAWRNGRLDRSEDDT
jgi:hypothetical protein